MARKKKAQDSQDDSWRSKLINLDLSPQQIAQALGIWGDKTYEQLNRDIDQAIVDGWGVKRRWSDYYGSVVVTVSFPDSHRSLSKHHVLGKHTDPTKATLLAWFIINELEPSGFFSDYSPAGKVDW